MAVRIEDYADTLRSHRVLHLVGRGNKPAATPLTVPVLRVLEARRGDRTEGRLTLRPTTGNPIDRRDAYRMVARIAKAQNGGLLTRVAQIRTLPRDVLSVRRHLDASRPARP